MKLKWLFIISLSVNVAAIFFAAKRIYYSIDRSSKEKKITYYLDRNTVYDLFKVDSTDIVFAGNSHTQMFDIEEYFTGNRIKNRGISGDISAGLLNRLDQFTKGHPKKVFIEIGFNDIIKKINSDSIAKNIKLICEKITRDSPRTKVYVLSVFPSDATIGKVYVKDSIPILNQKIKSYCAKAGISYIDLYSGMSDNGGLRKEFDSGDKIHLNGQGYLFWSEKIKAYLF